MKKASKNKIIVIKCEKSHFTQITNEITRNIKLSDFAIRLYGYLKSHNENFYLSVRTIANYLRISDYKVKNGIKELKQSGFLEIERNGNEFIYKLYDTTANEEYKIKEMLQENQLDFTDIQNIYRIINNGKITEETRKAINEKLQKILKTNWLED